MTIWNARRTEPLAPDLDLVLCGECLDRYKNVQDYCPICYQLYDNERYGCQTKPYSSKVDRKPTQLIETVINANIGTTRISKKGKKAVNMEASSITSLADNENAAFSETVLDNADVVEEAFIPVVQSEVEEALENTVVTLNADDDMIECNECNRWIHALCEGMDEGQYHAITEGRHPVWGDEYLCPICRVRLGLEILEELSTIDTTRMFAYPVTESVASSYFDIIRNPMDMSTMQGKAKKGQYKSLQALRQDFELMCLNAIRFNKVHDQYWNAAKKFYVQGVLIFDEHTRKSHQTAYGLELQEVLDEYATTENRNSRKKKPKRKSEDHNANSIGDDVLKKKKPDVLAVKNGDISEHEQTSSMTEELGKQSTEQNPMEISSEVLKNDLRLHTCLYPYDEAECYQSCFAVVQPIDEAYFTFTQDICFLCGSKGATDCMLFCVDCGECFHSFCANAPFSTMTASTRTNWRCSNCKLCYCCGVASKDDATTLIYCECCDKSYHMLCLKPAINPGLVPEKINWYCADCVTCRYCDGIPFPSWGLKTVECAHCVIVKGKKNRCLNEISKISYIKDLKSIVVLTIKTYGVWLAAEIDRWQTISETFYIARPGITRIVSNQYEDPRGWVSTALQTTDPLSQDRNSAQLCSHCSRMCITNYVPCQNCYSRTHYSCINTIFDGPLFTGTKSMTIAETAATICADYLCKRCILYLYGYESQFGTWDQSVSIYAAAAEIQRNRTIYQVKKLQSDVSTYRTGMCSLIYWAASRAFSNIAEETVVKSPVTNCSYIHWFCSLNVPSWVRCRAEEFVLLLKRYLDAGENIVAPDIARKQLCIQQFCYKYARGGVVESTSPSNNICSEEETKLVATLAAAYLHCVYIELPKAVYTNDCSSIAREILQMSFSNGKINVSNQTVSSTEVNVLANQLKVLHCFLSNVKIVTSIVCNSIGSKKGSVAITAEQGGDSVNCEFRSYHEKEYYASCK